MNTRNNLVLALAIAMMSFALGEHVSAQSRPVQTVSVASAAVPPTKKPFQLVRVSSVASESQVSDLLYKRAAKGYRHVAFVAVGEGYSTYVLEP